MPYLISNSQVQAWKKCTENYRLSHIEKLEKKMGGKASSIGTVTHLVLQEYYEQRIKGASHEESKSKALAELLRIQQVHNDIYPMDAILQARILVDGYWEHYGEDSNWKILAIEQSFTLKITDEIHMPMRLDLLVWDYERNGAYLVDTKTTYDFWNEFAKEGRGQFPKYIATLRANGITVKGAILNQIRTRQLKDPLPEQLFSRDEIPITGAKIARHMHDHLVASREIVAFKKLSPKEQLANTSRLMDDKVCDFCQFKQLCLGYMNNEDTTIYKNEKFQRSTYGYS